MGTMKIMAVDDEKTVLGVIKANLECFNIHVDTFNDPVKALEELRQNRYDILIVDQIMPKMFGIELLREVKKIYGDDYYGILLSAYIDIELLEEAINDKLILNAMDKPVDFDKLKDVILEAEQSIRDRRNEAERIKKLEDGYLKLMDIKESLNEELDQKTKLLNCIYSIKDTNVVTQDPAMKTLIEKTKTYTNPRANVLITGESGSGKEVFARILHYRSDRSDAPFCKINCSAIPDTLFESEIFGYEKGAFTGAAKEKPGKFESANGGTLFLDEVGDLPLVQQAKLLTILEDREVTRIGGTKVIKLDVRVISATNRDLRKMTAEGSFRSDLFYRLDGIGLRIPPLRERKGDIPVLVLYYLLKISGDLGGPEKYFEDGALNYLATLDFPGNIRELNNLVYKLYCESESNCITINDIRNIREKSGEDATVLQTDKRMCNPEKCVVFEKNLSLQGMKEDAERRYIYFMLDRFGYNITLAAEFMGIDSSNLYKKIKGLSIDLH